MRDANDSIVAMHPSIRRVLKRNGSVLATIVGPFRDDVIVYC